MGAEARPNLRRHALGDLIERVRRERGLSLRAVARAGGLAPSTVAQLAGSRPLRQLPLPLTMRRLAEGLEVPLEDVRHAAAAAVRGQRVDVYRVKVNGGELEIRAALGPGEDSLTEGELAELGEAATAIVRRRR